MRAKRGSTAVRQKFARVSAHGSFVAQSSAGIGADSAR